MHSIEIGQLPQPSLKARDNFVAMYAQTLQEYFRFVNFQCPSGTQKLADRIHSTTSLERPLEGLRIIGGFCNKLEKITKNIYAGILWFGVNITSTEHIANVLVGVCSLSILALITHAWRQAVPLWHRIFQQWVDNAITPHIIYIWGACAVMPWTCRVRLGKEQRVHKAAKPFNVNSWQWPTKKLTTTFARDVPHKCQCGVGGREYSTIYYSVMTAARQQSLSNTPSNNSDGYFLAQRVALEQTHMFIRFIRYLNRALIFNAFALNSTLRNTLDFCE